jgi:hypothetical protein
MDIENEYMNPKRAEWANASLDAFIKAKGEKPSPADREDDIADLISDLGHLAKREGRDFAAIVQRALRNFEAEL